MLCLLYLFLIVLCGLLHKTVEQQYLLSLHEILLVYRKQNRPILVPDRYAQFIHLPNYVVISIQIFPPACDIMQILYNFASE